MMKTLRSWRVPLLVALTLFFAVPLWQLSSHDAYEPAKQFIYDHVPNYFKQDHGVYNNTLYKDANNINVHAQYNFSNPCDGFPNTDRIMLVMKTGATESLVKMPTQLLTTMQCLPDFLIFSDKEQQIGQYHLYNVLDRVDDSVKVSRKEFELYDAQLRCPVSQQDCTKDMGGGWDLDKYKFLNMVERTWEMRPNMDWYVFAEADTYIVWSNLVTWLREKAPKGELYVGSVAMINNKPFAHGGSGYVFSGAMLKKMIDNIPDLAATYDKKAQDECCGDLLISMAVEQAGGKVKQAHPMFNGEKPNTMPYGPGQWCEPIFTMHHVNPDEVSTVWQYEQTRTDKNKILQIRELYDAFMAPHLVSFRGDWDNGSDDTCYIGPEDEQQKRAPDHEKGRQKKQNEKNVIERSAHNSAAACSKVCEAAGLDINEEEYESLDSDVMRGLHIHDKYAERRNDKKFRKKRDCFQWKYNKGVCCTSRSFKLGKPKRENNKEDKWTSGWFVKGINDWIDAKGDCDKVAWKEPF